MKKTLKILLAVFAFFTILSVVLIKPLNNLDEIWNYNLARNIYDNLTPYKEFNMVTMPLLPLICGVFLQLIANELIVMRILAAVLAFSIIFAIYQVFVVLESKENISIISTFFIGLLLINYFCIDYNWASLLVVLLLICNEIKEYKKDDIILKANIKKDIIFGILAGLTFALKQTSGLLICAVVLGNKLLFARNKKDFCIYLKSFLYRLIGIMIPNLIVLLYLISNGAINDFISYTIKGISGFSNYIPYSNLLKPDIIGILAMLVPISFICFARKIIKEKNIILYYFELYGLAMLAVVFPISDNIHFLIGATPILVAILYEVNEKINIDKLTLDILYIFMITFLITYPLLNFYVYINNQENYSKLNHYSYIIVDKDLEKEIKEVNEYIRKSEKSVKILDARAAVYMIPIDIYNKDYDLLNKGNLGENGEQKLIEEIKNSKNVQYLLLKDENKLNWQTPLNIIASVKDTKVKVGEIGSFDIYE